MIKQSIKIHLNLLYPEIILSVMVIVIAFPLLWPLRSPILSNDFLMHCTQHAIVREAILKYRTLSLETVALGGGFPTIANPENPDLNPLVVLSIIGGEVAGLKLIYLVYAILAGLGTYWLCRYSLGLTLEGSLFAGTCLIASAVMPGKYVGGNPNEIQLALSPLGLHLLLQARKRRYLFALIGLSWLLLIDSKFMAWIFGLNILIAAGLWDFKQRKSGLVGSAQRPTLLPLALVALFMALLLGAIKILPVVEYFRENGGFKPTSLFSHAGTYNSVKGLSLGAILGDLSDPRLLLWKGSADGAFTIGPIAFLAALGSIAFIRHSWRVWILILFSVWLACANNIHLDLFRFLWNHVPGFNFIDKPAKYFAPLAATWLCVGAGICISHLSLKIPAGWRPTFLIALLIVSLPFPLALHRCAWREIVRIHPGVIANLRRVEHFFNLESRLNASTPMPHPDRAISYFNFKSGIGTIDAYIPISVLRGAVPRYFILPDSKLIENPAYVGEVESVDGKALDGEVIYQPNRISIRFSKSQTGAFIVNRNFDRAWRSINAGIQNHQGRLLLIPREPISKEIVLRYRPATFRIGVLISSFAFIAIASYSCMRARSRCKPPRKDPGEVLL